MANCPCGQYAGAVADELWTAKRAAEELGMKRRTLQLVAARRMQAEDPGIQRVGYMWAATEAWWREQAALVKVRRTWRGLPVNTHAGNMERKEGDPDADGD